MKAIKSDHEDEEVLLLCRGLKRNGYSVNESWIFTQEMRESVVNLQWKSQLDANEIVGHRTWESLSLIERPATERLIEKDFVPVPRLLDVEVAALKVVQQVEIGGKRGFFSSGKSVTLFEGHISWDQLKKWNTNPESHVKGNENVLYPKWEKGHYRGGMGKYDRLEQAHQINHEAANTSAS